MIRSFKSNLTAWLIYLAGIVVLGGIIGYTHLNFPSSWIERASIGLGLTAIVLEIDLVTVGLLLPLRKISSIKERTEKSIRRVRKMKAVIVTFRNFRCWLYLVVVPGIHFCLASYEGEISTFGELLIIVISSSSFPLLGLGLAKNRTLNEIVEGKTRRFSPSIKE